MCTQDIFAYSCRHSIQAPDTDRCAKSAENNLPRCSDIQEHVHQIPDTCPDCGADNQLNEEMKAVLEQSQLDFDARQRALGVITNDKDEEEAMQQIMRMSIKEAGNQQEWEEAELMQRVLKQSRIEFQQEQDALEGMWRQRPKGYNEENDKDNAWALGQTPTPVSAQSGYDTGGLLSNRVPAGRPSGNSGLFGAAPSSSSHNQPVVNPSPLRPSQAEGSAAAAARARWIQQTFPTPPSPQDRPHPMTYNTAFSAGDRIPSGRSPQSDIPVWGTAASTLPPSVTESGVPPFGRAVGARDLSPVGSPNRKPIEHCNRQRKGKNISVIPPAQVQSEQATEKQKSPFELEKRDFDIKSEHEDDSEADDEETATPSPRTLRASRIAAFEKRMFENAT